LKWAREDLIDRRAVGRRNGCERCPLTTTTRPDRCFNRRHKRRPLCSDDQSCADRVRSRRAGVVLPGGVAVDLRSEASAPLPERRSVVFVMAFTRERAVRMVIDNFVVLRPCRGANAPNTHEPASWPGERPECTDRLSGGQFPRGDDSHPSIRVSPSSEDTRAGARSLGQRDDPRGSPVAEVRPPVRPDVHFPQFWRSYRDHWGLFSM